LFVAENALLPLGPSDTAVNAEMAKKRDARISANSGSLIRASQAFSHRVLNRPDTNLKQAQVTAVFAVKLRYPIVFLGEDRNRTIVF
jgi:hypothetical protein